MTRLVPFGLAVLIALGAGAAAAADGSEPAACAAPAALAKIEPALANTAARIDHAKPLTIVAVGSSSTRGAGASDRTSWRGHQMMPSLLNATVALFVNAAVDAMLVPSAPLPSSSEPLLTVVVPV